MSFMIVADAGQMPDNWRVERTAVGTSVRSTALKPSCSKKAAAVVVEYLDPVGEGMPASHLMLILSPSDAAPEQVGGGRR